MKKTAIKNWDELSDRMPEYGLVADVDLVVIRYDDRVSVMYGRCAHRGALMSDGHVEGDNLICGVHGWDYHELASARFGFSWDKVLKTQAFHFKGGQGAKTGTGGHLPGIKVQGKIAQVRNLPEGEPAISPARFPDWTELSQGSCASFPSMTSPP
jgi:hypothetical protein